MSKPMLVTTTVVMLLLDYWPLNRGPAFAKATTRQAEVRGQKFNAEIWWNLIVEKLPLFGLSLASSIVALALQVQSPASVGQLPFGWRLQNALVTYVTYLWQMFRPANLAVFYPHPDDRLALWQVTLAAALLVAMTWVAVALRPGRPYLLVGSRWYLIMLLPVTGIRAAGLQGPAARCACLRKSGLYIALSCRA